MPDPADFGLGVGKPKEQRSRSHFHKPKGLKPVYYDPKSGRMYTAVKEKERKKRKRPDRDDFGMGRIF